MACARSPREFRLLTALSLTSRPNSRRRARALAGAAAVGLLLAAAQLAIAWRIAPAGPPAESYSRLCQWDCGWYEKIAALGYRSTVPPVRQNPDVSNVAFFPGYPMVARALWLASGELGMTPKAALLVLAQGAAAVFWGALWFLLRRWRIPRRGAALVLAAVAAHPAAFFLVTGYSESLFLALLVLYLLGARARTRGGWLAGCVAGAWLSATRIVGVVAAGALALGRGRRPLLYALAGVSGIAAFFAYCQLWFGNFGLYMQTQRIGWGIVPDYSAIVSVLVRPGEFAAAFPLDAGLARLSYGAFALLGAVELWLAWRGRGEGGRRRLPLYLMAFGFFFISLSGLRTVQLRSLVRYSLPWLLLLAVCAADLLRRAPPLPRGLRLTLSVALLCALGWLWWQLQVPHLRDFLEGRWFA